MDQEIEARLEVLEARSRAYTYILKTLDAGKVRAAMATYITRCQGEALENAYPPEIAERQHDTLKAMQREMDR